MALQELERKLAESYDGLREENKSLIQLLKDRQCKLKTSLGTDTLNSETIDNNGESDTLYPFLNHVKPKEKVNFNMTQSGELRSTQNTVDQQRETPIIITEGQQQKARHKLASSVNNSTDTRETNQRLNLLHNSQEGPSKTNRYVSNTNDTNTRSTLIQRKIIEDNVHVPSKYQHTPTGTPKLHRKHGLNFSYSDSESDDSTDSISRAQGIDNDIKDLEEKRQQRTLDQEMKEVESLMAQRLLDDPGNDRQHASIVRTIDHRPKNVLFDINEKEPLVETVSPMNNSKTSTTSSAKSSFMSRMRSMNSSMNGSRDARPLLGYDWIAGVLENEGLIEDTEGLYKEVDEFRRANREECVGSASVWDKSLDLRRPISPEIEDPGHTCIHSYTLNGRLFTESVNLNEDGKSMCPVCLISRKPPTKEDPAFVRVSIPRSSIAAPYKVIPHKRKSFDPSDSYALSKHCLAGWQNAKPSMLPTASTLDLKDKIIAKETTSYDEARKVAESFSRMGRLLDGKDLPEDRLAKELLNRTHCLRYELEVMKETLNPSKPTGGPLETY